MVALRSPQGCFTQSAGLLYAVRRVAERSRSNTALPCKRGQTPRTLRQAQGSFSGSGILGCRSLALRSPQGCFTQSAALLSAVCRVALRSPQDCQAQSAGLLSAVCRVAECSRSNTAFQLPRFTFSTGPFDRLRDPFRA